MFKSEWWFNEYLSASPSGRDIFHLKNFNTFTSTPIRVSNAVARAQSTFQMLTLLYKIPLFKSECVFNEHLSAKYDEQTVVLHQYGVHIYP